MRYKIPQSVLVVIYTQQQEVLLLRRADVVDAPFWQSVTGSLDSLQEPLQAAARREVQEETGITVPMHSKAGATVQGADMPSEAVQGVAIQGAVLQDWGLQNIYPIYARWAHRYAEGVSYNTEHVFGLCVPSRCAVTLNPREHTAYQWLPYMEAADWCFSPSNAEAILQIPQFVLAAHLPLRPSADGVA